MKKYLILLVAAISFAFTSCETVTEPGGTAVQDMAGEWWVTAVYKDAGVWKDSGVGHFKFSTYNTAANLSTEMWLNDHGSFWNFKSVVKVDYTAKTFLTTDSVTTNSASFPSEKVLITAGKVLKGAAKTPSNVAADSIVFTTVFNDDKDSIVYKISGFRRTGFPADDF